MNDLLTRFAPLGLALALAAWCGWPYVTLPDSAAQLADSDKLPRISRAMISPQFHAKVARDPFVPLSAPPQAKEEAPALLSAPRQLVSVALERPPVDPVEVLSNLKLNATSEFGGRTMALIDGDLYQAGDRLTLNDPEFTCTVHEILVDKVVVDHAGELFQMTYPVAFDLAAAHNRKTIVNRVNSQTKAVPSLWEMIKHQLSTTN